MKAETVYRKDVARYPVGLSRQEEFEIGERAMAGDSTAINLLVSCNLKLVQYIARKYYGAGIEIGDLIQIGNMGALRAAKTYDPSKGKYNNYATWYIRANITDALRKNDKRKKLSSGEGSADYLDKTLDEKFYDEDNLPEDVLLLETLANPKARNPEQVLACNDLGRLIDGLPDREATIIRMRYLLGMTLQEIGNCYNITREGVRQSETKALARLHRKLKMENLEFSDFFN